MPPFLALAVWFILLLGLLYYDPAKEAQNSPALWIPLIWMFIAASRLPTQWLGGQNVSAAQALEEGNPLDRTVFTLLILLALGVLISRSFSWGSLILRNSALVVFLLYALLSCVWSDFPLVAAKRWLRDLGNYFVILVVLSDPRPLEAVRTLLRRLSYLLVPLSIVLIKYFPSIGRIYSEWTGAVQFTGVTTTKDMLGAVCLVSCMFFFWDTLARWPERKGRRTRRILGINFAFISMTLWVLYLADAAACRVCLLLGCLVIAAARTRTVKRHPILLKAWVPLSVCLGLFLVFGVDMKATIAEAVGRNATFTDRTLLWPDLVQRATSPLFGAGYESFWLGPRLQEIWRRWPFRPNQAHNGYIEIYLELGFVGVVFLLGFLIGSYSSICKLDLTSGKSFTSLRLALWNMLPIYNITTSDFCKGELMWLIFLLGAIVLPVREEERVQALSLPGGTAAVKAPGWRLRPTTLRRS